MLPSNSEFQVFKLVQSTQKYCPQHFFLALVELITSHFRIYIRPNYNLGKITFTRNAQALLCTHERAAAATI